MNSPSRWAERIRNIINMLAATEETFLLEILLEHTDGEVAQFLWQVAFQLPFYGGFNALEVVAKVLNFHGY